VQGPQQGLTTISPLLYIVIDKVPKIKYWQAFTGILLASTNTNENQIVLT
jgi:hypothetical protein